MCKNEESSKILREWAVKKGKVDLIDIYPIRSGRDHGVHMIPEYELHYKVDLGEGHPDQGKPFTMIRGSLE